MNLNARQKTSTNLSGQNRRHSGCDRQNVITSNVFGELWTKLKRTKYRPFASDMRISAKRGNYFYPDIVVACGERKFEDEKKDVLINPAVIIEVISKSTNLKDRNEKFDFYILLESLTGLRFNRTGRNGNRTFFADCRQRLERADVH